MAEATIQYGEKKTIVDANGNGRLDAISNTIKQYFGITYELSTYEEHALSHGSSSKAMAYVGITHDGKNYWGAGVDEDCVLRRDIVLGGQLHLHGTEREGVHALEERDHEGSLAGDGAHLAGAGDDHELIRRAFAPAALEHQYENHDTDGCGEQVEDQRFEKHHRVSFPSRVARAEPPGYRQLRRARAGLTIGTTPVQSNRRNSKAAAIM